MQWPTFACQIAHCPAWLTVGTSPCGVALGGSRGHARAEERAGGKAAFLAAKGPGCQAGLCQPVAPALDTSLELICLAVGSVCKLHRPFAAPLCPLAWPSKGSQARLTDRPSHLTHNRELPAETCTRASEEWRWTEQGPLYTLPRAAENTRKSPIWIFMSEMKITKGAQIWTFGCYINMLQMTLMMRRSILCVMSKSFTPAW